MKTRCTDYVFDASAQTVELTGLASVTQNGLLIIVNVTDNIIIYNFADPTKGATFDGISTFILVYDTTSMDDADKLLIYYDLPDSVLNPIGKITITDDQDVYILPIVDTDGGGNPGINVKIMGSGGAVSIPVEINGAVAVYSRGSFSTVTSVISSATSVTLLAENYERQSAVIYNDSTSILYVKLGAIASNTSFTFKMYPEDTVEVPNSYCQIIDGIWESANGFARITEIY